MDAHPSFEARIFATLDQQAAEIKGLENQLVVMTIGTMAALILVGLGIYAIGKQLEK
jgi:hypothetical protein